MFSMVAFIWPAASPIFVVAPSASIEAVPETNTVSPAGVVAFEAREKAEP